MAKPNKVQQEQYTRYMGYAIDCLLNIASYNDFGEKLCRHVNKEKPDVPTREQLQEFRSQNEPKDGWKDTNGDRWNLTEGRMKQIIEIFWFAAEYRNFWQGDFEPFTPEKALPNYTYPE